MSDKLTERQLKLLKAIIEEFIATAEPVGSENLVKKHKFKFSPATTRNEMAALMREGYLTQPHTSGGRIPTALGMRYYVNSMVNPQEIPVKSEVYLKQKVFQERFSFERMAREVARSLSESCGYLGFVTTADGHVFSAGSVNLLEHPEFYDIGVFRAVLHAIDDHDLLHSIFSKVKTPEDRVHVLIGEELGLSNLEPVGLGFAHYNSGKRAGAVGVIGPYRMNYTKTIPYVKYFSHLLSELGRGW